MMLNVFLTLALMLCVSCEDKTETEEEKINKIVRLPAAVEVELLTIQSDDDEIGQFQELKMKDCIDEEVYSNENLMQYKTEGDLLCGFYAFQANKKQGTGSDAYSDADESVERLKYFTESVKSVNEVNARFAKGESTWTATINFFSDMTEKEKYPYSHGISDVGVGAGLGAGLGAGMGAGLGAGVGVALGGVGPYDVLGATPDQGVPTSRETETDEEKINKIVRLPKEIEVELLTVKSDDNEIGQYTALEIKDCISEEVYSNDNLTEYKDGRDLLCAFYAFQANKKDGTGLPTYSDAQESLSRLQTFAKSVEKVLKINNQHANREITWTAEINFFADMLPEEMHPYANGVIFDMISVGTPEPEGDEGTEEKVKKIVRLSEAHEAAEMNNDNDEVSDFKTMDIESCVDETMYGYDNLQNIDSSDKYLCAFYAFQANKKEGVGLKSYADQDEAKERLGLFTKCVSDVQKRKEEYERGEITYTAAVNFFCDMTDKEKHPYSHGIKNDIANKMSVFGVNPVDLKTGAEKMEKVVRLSKPDELAEIGSDSNEGTGSGVVSLEECVDSSIYDYVNLDDLVSKRDYVCAFYAFQANKEQGVGLKRYKSNKESKRRLVHFTQCVKTVKKMNSNFESGKTTFSGEVNFFCDMTNEERKMYSRGINKAIGRDMNNRVLVVMNTSPEEDFEDHPVGNGGVSTDMVGKLGSILHG